MLYNVACIGLTSNMKGLDMIKQKHLIVMLIIVILSSLCTPSAIALSRKERKNRIAVRKQYKKQRANELRYRHNIPGMMSNKPTTLGMPRGKPTRVRNTTNRWRHGTVRTIWTKPDVVKPKADNTELAVSKLERIIRRFEKENNALQKEINRLKTIIKNRSHD